MPLVDHLEELRQRVLRSLVAVVVATMVMILVSDQHLQILLVDLLVFSELEINIPKVENLVKQVV